MTDELTAENPKEGIANAPLAEACRIVISELRTGVNTAKNALALLKWELRPEREEPFTDAQRQQVIAMAEAGIQEADMLINELLVEGLLRRLEIR